MDHGTHAADKEDITANSEFIAWLTKINLLAYRPALEDQGFDAVESLVLLTDDEINELSSAVAMKFGHKKRFPVEIREAREEIQLQKDLAKLQRGEVLREAQDRASTKTKARSQDDQEDERKADTKPIAPKSIAAQLHETQKEIMHQQDSTTAGGKGAQNQQLHTLPPGKRFHFFASHSE